MGAGPSPLPSLKTQLNALLCRGPTQPPSSRSHAVTSTLIILRPPPSFTSDLLREERGFPDNKLTRSHGSSITYFTINFIWSHPDHKPDVSPN